MRIRTISADNLSEAKNRASLLFGNKYVVLESADAKSGLPAYIKVALDEDVSIREPSVPQKEPRKPVHLLQPLMKQVEDLMDKGSKTITAFKNDNGESGHEEFPGKTGEFNYRPPSSHSGNREGVYFEKSKNFGAYLDQNRQNQDRKEEKNPEKDSSGFAKTEHTVRLVQNYETAKPGPVCTDDIHRRISRLEEYTRLISGNLLPSPAGHPCYGLLQTNGFRDQDIIEITNHLPGTGLSPDQIQVSMVNYLEKVLEPRKPGIDNESLIFVTAFDGIDPLKLVSEVIRYNTKFQSENLNSPAIITIDDMAVPGNHFLQRFEVLKAGNKSEFTEICNGRSGKQPLFIVTNPFLFHLESTAERFYHYEQMFSDMNRDPEFHLVVHPLFEAEQFAGYVPSGSGFKSKFISVLNSEACAYNAGNLYTLNRLLDTRTGFVCNGQQEAVLINADIFLKQIFNFD